MEGSHRSETFWQECQKYLSKELSEGQNNLKVYFLILTPLPKMFQVLAPLPLFLVSLFPPRRLGLFLKKSEKIVQ